MTVQPLFEDKQNWRTRADCQYVSADFFPEDPTDRSAALTFCSSCPVQRDCLDWAISHDQREGTWGGLSEGQRAILHDISYLLPAALIGLQALVQGEIGQKYYRTRRNKGHSAEGRVLTLDEKMQIKDLARSARERYTHEQARAYRLYIGWLYVVGNVDKHDLLDCGVVDDRLIWRYAREYREYAGLEMVS